MKKITGNSKILNASLTNFAYREVMSWTSHMRTPILVGRTYFCAAALMLALARFDGEVAFLWIASALLIAHLSTRPIAIWWQSLIPAAIGSALATGLFGLGWTLALPFAAIGMVEASLGAYIMQCLLSSKRALGSPIWLMKFFLAAGVVAPAVAAILAALVLLPSDRSVLATLSSFFPGHALGNLTFTPLALLIASGEFRATIHRLGKREWMETLLLVVMGCAVTILSFSQKQLPLLFLPILPTVLASLRLGRLGAAAAIVLLALIGGTIQSWVQAQCSFWAQTPPSKCSSFKPILL